MTYVQGGTIQASDYNTFRSRLLTVYGVGSGKYGYGQDITVIPLVAVGDDVTSLQWTTLRNLIGTCASHQGRTVDIPALDLLAVNATIKAHPPAQGDFSAALATINTNHLNAAVGSTTVFNSALTRSRTTAWSNLLRHELSVAFTDEDKARYFFNRGGRIRFRLSRNGGTGTASDTAWSSLFTAIGTIEFSITGGAALNAFGTSSSVGYYELNTQQFDTAQVVYTATLDSQRVVRIIARTDSGPQGSNGDNGHIIQFRVQLSDSASGNVNDGTYVSEVDIERATTYLTIDPPTLSTLVDFANSGGTVNAGTVSLFEIAARSSSWADNKFIYTMPSGKQIPDNATIFVIVGNEYDSGNVARNVNRVTDSAGNTYEKDLERVDTNGGYSPSAFAIMRSSTGNPVPVGSTITVNFSNYADRRMVWIGYALGLIGSPLDKTASAVTSSGTSKTVTSAVTTQATELVIGVLVTGQVETINEAAGYTRFSEADANQNNLHVAYKVVTNTGAQTYNPTTSDSVDAVIGVATYKVG